MGVFKEGDIVIGKVSFADSHIFKIRPTLIIVERLTSNDFIVLYITKTSYSDEYSIPIYANDIETGHIKYIPSYVRVNKPHILPRNKLYNKVAELKEEKMKQITEVWEKYRE